MVRLWASIISFFSLYVVSSNFQYAEGGAEMLRSMHILWGAKLHLSWRTVKGINFLQKELLRDGSWEQDIDGLVQDCSNSSALAMELLQSCTMPSIWYC